ncbi:hypothetical protein P5V15_010294 [Pogonomyrmex californicus]
MKCSHYFEEIISLDNASQHSCFIGKDVFINNGNNLFTQTENKPAIWDRNATLAVLSLYEAKIDILDHPKKKMRWKINALIKKIECIDNNSKSGRSLMTFEWFDQLDEILGQQKNAVAKYTVSSKFIHLTSKSSTSLTNSLVKSFTSSTALSANKKIALENQLLAYLKTKNERDKINDEKHADILEQKKEIIKLKKKHLALKEKEIDQQKEYFS